LHSNNEFHKYLQSYYNGTIKKRYRKKKAVIRPDHAEYDLEVYRMCVEKNTAFRLPVMVMRGGTSKGMYLLEEDLPKDRSEWEPILLRLMGSPDKKQIDGLGGAQSVTSKVAIVKKSDRPDADVDYTFAQVSVDKPIVSYKGNCGNISSGVGPFAIERGLVKAGEDNTSVRIFNTNTEKIIIADVKTPNGTVSYEGDFKIAGVPGTSSPIKLKFVEPSGTLGNGLLPTGNVVDVLDVPGFGPVEVSIVDAANPLVFVKAQALGLTGRELPDDLNGDPDKLELLEKVRGMAAVKLELIEDYTRSAWDTPGIPKMTFVAEAEDYLTADGKEIKREDIDLLSRMMSMQKAHPSYAMTGAMCTAAAAVIPGSIVNQVLSENTDTQYIRIGHPGGVLECGVDYEANGSVPFITDTFGFRTANLLMEGTAHVNTRGM
jgi:2-methylaconitate cis-trans-isomerase PrpF